MPKGLQANLNFRRECLRRAAGDEEVQHELRMACSRSLLFYVNAFVWTLDPRKDPSEQPFITYPFQDLVLIQIADAIGDYDLFVEKSRDMGLTWMALIVMDWKWRFRRMQSFMCVSRKETLVDQIGNPDSLFSKLDFLDDHLPGWLKVSRERKKLNIRNMDNGSVIDGEATVSDVGRGGRRTAIFLDEFAAMDTDRPGTGAEVLSATRDNTNCRIINSTPKGAANAFAKLRENPNLRKIRAHWTLHPEKAAELWHDPSGKPRSPWYDLQCERALHPMEIAQEIDIDYLASSDVFFDLEVLKEIKDRDAVPSFCAGDIEIDEDGHVEFVPGGDFLLKLWIFPQANGQIPIDRSFAAGVDISYGTRASNSVVSIADTTTGEKVAEYVTNSQTPEDFAKTAVGLARWFNDAFMKWEATGPGRSFGRKVIESGYRNVHYRRPEDRLGGKISDVPGWFPTIPTKNAMYGDYRAALKDGSFINRSIDGLEECSHIVYTTDGRVCFDESKSCSIPSGRGDGHGDIVTADAICWSAMKDTPKRRVEDVKPPVGSFRQRRLDWEETRTKKGAY